MFALGAMLRTSPLSRRAFFAADGAAFIVQALADDAPSRACQGAGHRRRRVREPHGARHRRERTNVGDGGAALAIKGVRGVCAPHASRVARLEGKGEFIIFYFRVCFRTGDSTDIVFCSQAVRALKAAMTVDAVVSGGAHERARAEGGEGEGRGGCAEGGGVVLPRQRARGPGRRGVHGGGGEEAEDLSDVVAAPEPAAANDEL